MWGQDVDRVTVANIAFIFIKLYNNSLRRNSLLDCVGLLEISYPDLLKELKKCTVTFIFLELKL